MKFKKIIASMCAASLILSSFTALAFNDVSDPLAKKSVNTLSSLGIVNGVGNGNFNPNGNVTRAEFAKMAVLTLGNGDIDAYKNLTIFPDVPNTFWASGYINSAVKNYKIIKGMPDGTFKPSGNINFGEAVTMLLYMLGYSIEDIGAYWPTDYISLANKLGITKGVSLSATATVSRANAAILLSNLLSTDTKEGKPLIENSFPYTDGDAYIISYTSTELTLLIGDTTVTKNHNMTNIPYGTLGTVVYTNSSKNTVKGFVLLSSSEEVTIKTAEFNRLITENGYISIPKDAFLIVDGKKKSYSENFLEIFSGSSVIINKDSSGNITSVYSDNNISSDQTYLYANNVNIPNNYTIYKNGVVIAKSDINENDVVSINHSSNKVYVSSNTITGPLSTVSPSIYYPSKIKVLDTEFNVSESAWTGFQDISLGNTVTLFLDFKGNVAFAKKNFQTTQIAYLNSFDGSSTVNITLPSGHTVDMKNINTASSGYFTSNGNSVSNIHKYVGKFVNLTFSSTNSASVKLYDFTTKPSGDYVISSKKLGSYTVSPAVSYYEAFDSISPYSKISASDITLDKIPSENILYVTFDSSNKIDRIIFKNLTGNTLNYGIGFLTREEHFVDFNGSVSSYFTNIYTLKNASNNLTYMALNDTRAYDIPIGIPKNMESMPFIQHIPINTLKQSGTATQENFLGLKYVKLDGTTYSISDDVVVYHKDSQTFMSLNYARQNYKNFTIYADNALQGNVVRVIITK